MQTGGLHSLMEERPLCQITFKLIPPPQEQPFNQKSNQSDLKTLHWNRPMEHSPESIEAKLDDDSDTKNRESGRFAALIRTFSRRGRREEASRSEREATEA